jgi:alanyl-tRNA synthetase
MKAGEIQREIEQKISELREKQAARVEELKKLKRKGNVKEMKARVSEWKKKGYNTLTLDYKLKGLNVKEMKQIMDKWKKKYKTEGYKKK